MKKLLLLSLILLGANTYAGETFSTYIKAGVEFGGNFELEYQGDKAKESADTGGSLGVEFTGKIKENFELGLGISGEFRNVSLGDDIDLGVISVPVYGVAKYNFNTLSNGITPFAKAYYGLYSINGGSHTESYYPKNKITIQRDGGFGGYYGLGIGAEFSNNITVELAYTFNTAEVEAEVENPRFVSEYVYVWEKEKDTADLDFSKLTLSIGYKF